MQPIRLPPELHDAIIDCLHDDAPTLARCALVCRAWLPAARFHAWRRLPLRCAADALDRFAAALETCPAIAHCVRDAVIAQRKEKVRFCTWEDLHLLGAALAMLGRLPNLATVTLDGLWFGAPSAGGESGAQGLADHIFPSVRALTISTCSFESFSDVRNLCAAFPALRTVRFDGVWWGHWLLAQPGGRRTDGPGERLLVHGKLQWTELDLGSCFSRDVVIDWLLDCLEEDSVRTLRLPLIGAYDTRLKDLLRYVGPSLERLDIGSPSTSATRLRDANDAPRPVSSLLDLSACTSLKTLSLGVPTYRDAGFITRWLVALLLQVASPGLEELRFAIYPILRGDAADAFTMLSAFDWGLVVRVLGGYEPERSLLGDVRRDLARLGSFGDMRANGRFASLKKVTFRAGRAMDYVQVPSAFLPLGPHLRKLAETFFAPLGNRGIELGFE